MSADSFFRAYVECALWSSMDNADDSGGEPLDANYSSCDIDPDTLAAMRADCEDFRDANANDLRDWNDEQAGHDFWLTRNRHGTGFWDRATGTKDQRDRLTANAHAYGECALYVGADEWIYL